ncbi:MAG: hypothetical protein H6Q65_684 [Firmicutes bacterium]|nr:hypothetical protein [Bacillota bacterium]
MNMPPLTDLLSKVDNRYTLVTLVGKRAREISAGSEVLVDCESSKPVTIAMEEIVQGKITYQRTKESIK